MYWTQWPVIGLACVFFVSMGWGVKGHFANAAPLPAGMRRTTVLSALAFAWFLEGQWQVLVGRARVPPRDEVLASCVILVAFGLFWWSVAATRDPRLAVAFSPCSPTFVVTSGPYAWIRHPFYASYLMFWIATAITSPNLAYWVVPVILMALYGSVAVAEEARFAASPAAAAYLRYRGQTGMFMPVLRPSAPRVVK